MEQLSLAQLSIPRGEFSEPSPSSLSNHELDPGFIAMVRKSPFSGVINEDPLDHFQEFKELCSSLPKHDAGNLAVEIVFFLSH